jgi:hypothetical protein
VNCERCDVSFPTGTKRCIHCGGRTGPGRLHIMGASPQGHDVTSYGSGEDIHVQPVGEGGLDPLNADEVTEGGRSGLMRSAVTLVWVLLAVGFSIVRACSEN